jgi:hypothetical protein
LSTSSPTAGFALHRSTSHALTPTIPTASFFSTPAESPALRRLSLGAAPATAPAPSSDLSLVSSTVIDSPASSTEDDRPPSDNWRSRIFSSDDPDLTVRSASPSTRVNGSSSTPPCLPPLPPASHDFFLVDSQHRTQATPPAVVKPERRMMLPSPKPTPPLDPTRSRVPLLVPLLL